MEKVIFTVYPDNDGRITVTNTIKLIMNHISEIKVPDTDITKIPLASLTLVKDNTKHCIDGYAEGKRWKDGKCTEYQFTLIFA